MISWVKSYYITDLYHVIKMQRKWNVFSRLLMRTYVLCQVTNMLWKFQIYRFLVTVGKNYVDLEGFY